MSINKVTGVGVPGHNLGDELSDEETLALKRSPYADMITVFDNSARRRLDMQDATPSKPVGSVPHTNARQYHPDLAVGALSEQTPVAMGEAMHASTAIQQPTLNERLRDANLGYQLDPGKVLTARPAPSEEAKGSPKLAPYAHEAPVAPAQESAETLDKKPAEGPSKGLAAAGPGPVMNDAPAAASTQDKAPDAAKVI